MINFNEYQENSNNPNAQGAVGQNILPASLLRPTPALPAGHHSVSQNQTVGSIPVDNFDQVAAAKQHSMSVHHNVGQRDSSLTEVDSFLNELHGGRGDRSSQHLNPSQQNSHSQVQQSGDDIGKLDILLKKLIDSKKITKKQLIQKLMSVSEGIDGITVDEDPTENILDAESED